MFGKKKNNGDKPRKSFLTVGPVLHYSHSNVHRSWWLTVAAYLCVCLFWSKITTGNLDALQLQSVENVDIWALGRFVVMPVNIFEYPWQILVLGLLMAMISFVPILISQLLSSRYSVLLVLMTAFIAKLPTIAIVIAVCCAAVACRPLRFRSRFISIVLCSSPLLAYWGAFGGYVDVDPVKWGLSYAPWFSAWLLGLLIAAVVLAIGHYTRYKPGAIAFVTIFSLLVAGYVFFDRISFAESDYQIYVVSNNPEECSDFHSRSISDIVDEAASEPLPEKNITMPVFPEDVHWYDSEQDIEQRVDTNDDDQDQREQLLEELEVMVNINVWPLWFMENADKDFYDFKRKRNARIDQLNYFINNHPGSKRMPIALYYKAILREYLPNPKALRRNEELKFYSDYPRPEVFPDWVRLYRDYPQSPESLEARWRIAVNLCRKGDFQTALSLCREAVNLSEKVKERLSEQSSNDTDIFIPPAETAIAERELEDILFRTRYLMELIENNNKPNDQAYKLRFASFLGLNPYKIEYSEKLKILLDQCGEQCPMRDNLKLAVIRAKPDNAEKKKQLEDFISQHPKADCRPEAMYELALCCIQIRRELEQDSPERAEYLNQARQILERITQQYPESVFNGQAQSSLNGLPREEQS